MTTRPHAVMFHHFHGPGHAQSQGSISADQLERIIDYYGDRLTPPKAWHRFAEVGMLESDVCLSFDDGLRCQYDIALPVLEKYNMTAFWFIYTSIFEGKVEMMEVYRKFRMECFESVDDFYNQFHLRANGSISPEIAKQDLSSTAKYNHDDWSQFPFYTRVDTYFRYMRDKILGPERYAAIMDRMMADKDFDYDDYASGLWMDKLCLQQLHARGHIIGLHSHTHPMNIGELSVKEQASEYEQNHYVLTGLIDASPTAMSYPCNSYNASTVGIAASLGITIGFRANMAEGFTGPYEYPREDCANLVRRLEPCPA